MSSASREEGVTKPVWLLFLPGASTRQPRGEGSPRAHPGAHLGGRCLRKCIVARAVSPEPERLRQVAVDGAAESSRANGTNARIIRG